MLVVICGLSFAGKTTLGGAVARRFNHKQVDVDATKVRLYGVRFDDNALDQDAWNRIYDETDLEIARYLRSRASVIDASRNFRKAERSHARHIAALNGGKFLLIYMDTPEDVPGNACSPIDNTRRGPTGVTPASMRSSALWSRRVLMSARCSAITRTTSSAGSASIQLC